MPSYWTVTEILWTFSIYLETVALLPQVATLVEHAEW